MTVYIEYVLIDNFVIDFLLLKTTFSITGAPVKNLRLIFCALFGCVFALTYPLIETLPIILTAVKILVGLLLLLFAGNYKNVKYFYVNAAVFFTLTFALGGAIIGVYTLFGLDYSAEISTALMVVPAYVLIRAVTAVIKYIYKRKTVASVTYKCVLTLGGKVVSADGFMDTGNNLYDGDSPVVVCGKSTALKLFADKFPTVKRISFSTVSGRGEMLLFKIDALKIYYGKEANIYNNVTAGVSRNGADKFGLILHPALGGKYAETDFGQVEKIS